MPVHNVCLVQELRLADARFHTTPCAPKLVPASFVMETTRYSLVIGQLSKRRLT